MKLALKVKGHGEMQPVLLEYRTTRDVLQHAIRSKYCHNSNYCCFG